MSIISYLAELFKLPSYAKYSETLDMFREKNCIAACLMYAKG